MFSKFLGKLRSVQGPVNSLVFPSHLVQPTYTQDGPIHGASAEETSSISSVTRAFNEYDAELFWIDTVPCILFNGGRLAYKVLVYAHCNAEDMWNSHEMLQHFRDRLPAHVITFEYPGYGVADGTASDQSCNEALLAVYDWLTTNQAVPPDDIILCGRSIGTGPCCWLAAQKEDLGGLVLVSAFTSVKAVVRNITQQSESKRMSAAGSAAQYLIQDRYRNADELANVRCSVVLIHGTDDQVCSPDDAEILYEACLSTPHRQLCLVPGLDHDNVLEFITEVVEQVGRSFDCSAKPPRALNRTADYSCVRERAMTV